jgi:hypothetical protein
MGATMTSIRFAKRVEKGGKKTSGSDSMMLCRLIIHSQDAVCDACDRAFLRCHRDVSSGDCSILSNSTIPKGMKAVPITRIRRLPDQPCSIFAWMT